MVTTRQRAPQGVPGSSVTAFLCPFAIFEGLFTLVLIVMLLLGPPFDTRFMPDANGHLPWPLIQWALSTPAGVLTAAFFVAVLTGLPQALLTARTWPAYAVAHARDVTGREPELWERQPARESAAVRAERWLGRDPRGRTWNRVLLVLSVAFGLAVVLATGIGLTLQFVSIGVVPCNGPKCAPHISLAPIILVGVWAGLCFATWMQYRWMRHVEAECGLSLIWLTSGNVWRSVVWRSAYHYIRWPSTSSEQAAAALARQCPTTPWPAVRALALTVLASAPLFLLISVQGVLTIWLPTQWVP